MRSLIVLALMLPAAASAGRPMARPEPPQTAQRRPPVQLQVPGDPEIREIRRSMTDLRGLISTLRNEAMVAEMQRRLDRMDRQLAGLDRVRWELLDTASAFEAQSIDCAQELDIARRPPPPPPEPIQEVWYPPEPVVTSPRELGAIRQAVDNASFSKEKLATLRSASTDRVFTCAQVITLMGAFNFGDDKVEAAAALRPLVVDPQNWFTVYGAFDFESDRRKLRQRVGD